MITIGIIILVVLGLIGHLIGPILDVLFWLFTGCIKVFLYIFVFIFVIVFLINIIGG